MSGDNFSGINNAIPESDLPGGHLKRFEKKLNSTFVIGSRLWMYQRIAIAASVAAFIVLSTIVAINLGELKTQKTVLYSISSELYETELYLAGEIEEKMEILTASNSFDKAILDDIREIDKSFDEVKKELFRNPYDDRLISAVIETYRVKLDLLDEVLLKSANNNI